jgi:hypothetical protein
MRYRYQTKRKDLNTGKLERAATSDVEVSQSGDGEA